MGKTFFKNVVTIGEASILLGVSKGTLRRWEREGKLLPSMRTLGNHRRYCLSELRLLFLNEPTQDKKELTVAYARVSSDDQKEDLKRQEEVLKTELKKIGQKTELISDLGSGMNFKKRGLSKLLTLLLEGRVETLILTHKDRLLRFGSDLIFLICSHVGTKVVILDDHAQSKSDEEIFAADVIELITVFSARLYGKRSHKNRRAKDLARAA